MCISRNTDHYPYRDEIEEIAKICDPEIREEFGNQILVQKNDEWLTQIENDIQTIQTIMEIGAGSTLKDVTSIGYV